MAEEVTKSETVTTTSNGTVKISVEKYEELQALANKPQQVTYNRIEKTPEMQASDLRNTGAFLMGGGGSLFLIGAVQFYFGMKKLKALKV